MAPFSPGSVEIGPGTLYAAPIGTTEPTAVTGAWGAGWVALGYTDSGSTVSSQITTDQVTVEEEVDPILNAVTGRVITQTFSLAEQTAKNMLIALNAGVGTPGTGTGLVAATTGTNADGSIWVEPPVPGTEVRIMLGWDAAPKGATSGVANAFGRWIGRQCLQTGNLQMTRRKGNNKVLYTCTFTLEKPATGLNPFRQIFPASLTS